MREREKKKVEWKEAKMERRRGWEETRWRKMKE